MSVSILERLGESRDGPSIRIETGANGEPRELERSDLYRLACLAGVWFRDRGVEPGDRIVTLLPTGRPLLQCIFGAWAANAAVCVLAPTIDNGRSTLSHKILDVMLRTISPRIVVTARGVESDLRSLIEAAGASVVTIDDIPTDGSVRPPVKSDPADLAFVQFTSGSTGVPKAVCIEHRQLIENAKNTAEWTGYSSVDKFVSWLPLHHDFGFVVGCMMPILMNSRLVLISTELFSKNPVIWLSTIAEERATFSASPPSAAAMLTKPLFSRRLAGLDLSSLRVLWFGSEPVSARIVHEFEGCLARYGLAEGVVAPGYGMAEATLTVAVRGTGMPRLSAWISTSDYFSDGSVSKAAPGGSDALELLSNGRPIPTVRVRVVDDLDNDIPEFAQGRILVSSPMVTRRYFGSSDDPQSGGWLDTGDLGFLLNGEIFVTGRSKDLIVRGGFNVHPHTLEEVVVRELGDDAQRAVAFSIPRRDNLLDEIFVGIEIRRAPPSADEFAARVRAIVQREVGIQIDIVTPLPKGSIPRTTSGKVQRGRARELYLAGELAATATNEIA